MSRYSDRQLEDAILASRSWREVLRTLGLTSSSGANIRSVRRRADRLSIDYSHFTRGRRWTATDLDEVIASSTSWTEVADRLSLSGSSVGARLRGHAVRLGVDFTHLETSSRETHLCELRPQPQRLPRAGSLLAAAWFELCGAEVSWPLEPSRYDLLVWLNGQAQRVQVKTTNVRENGVWRVWLSTTSKGRRVYDPKEIDSFFVIDGELNYYLIPVTAVGGLSGINLAAYAAYQVTPM